MPRLIILLLIVVVMAALAIQNPESLSLVILGGYRTPEISLGLMLVGAAALGSLLTLILYGLVGLRRPPESKYRPMGQRVPYPNSPGSTTLPPSGPAFGADSSPAAKPASGPYGSASSTAFVSEPATPQDSTPPPSDSSRHNAPPYENAAYQTAYQAPFSSTDASVPEPVESVSEPESSPEPRSVIRNPFAQKKKNKGKREAPVENKKVGDEWGDLRTAEQLNSWEAIGEAARSSGQNAGNKPGFFDSIATGIGIGSSSPQAAGQMADDIAEGWDENGYRSDDYRSDDYRSDDYDKRNSDGLDSGWENFDSYDSPPADGPQKYVYNDGLYDDDGPYIEADSPERTDPEDGVYEADYRVIEPPSKPLDNELEDEDNYYPS